MKKMQLSLRPMALSVLVLTLSGCTTSSLLVPLNLGLEIYKASVEFLEKVKTK